MGVLGPKGIIYEKAYHYRNYKIAVGKLFWGMSGNYIPTSLIFIRA